MITLFCCKKKALAIKCSFLLFLLWFKNALDKWFYNDCLSSVEICEHTGILYISFSYSYPVIVMNSDRPAANIVCYRMQVTFSNYLVCTLHPSNNAFGNNLVTKMPRVGIMDRKVHFPSVLLQASSATES